MSADANDQLCQQITDLQLLVMGQERVIESYSELLRDQQEQITLLSGRLSLLEQKMTKHEVVGETIDQHEVPPHY